MKKVDKKFGGDKSTVVQGDNVVCEHVTLHKATDTYWQLHTTFDFTGVSRETILKLAAETLVIRWRTAFKNADKIDEESADNQVVSVVKMLKGSKPRMSKADRAAKTLADMSDAEKIAFIREHAKALGIEVTLPETEEESNEEGELDETEEQEQQ